MAELYLREDLAIAWDGEDPFAAAFALRGELARDVPGRQTLRTEINGRSYYIKRHSGVGWLEILKNVLTGKRPVLGADNEFLAARKLAAHGVDTLPVAAFGRRGASPAARQSFLVTDDLSPAISLETLCVTWPEEPPEPELKRALIRRVAGIARQMHGLGINHQDFYICHFLLRTDHVPALSEIADLPLHVIDLHRAELRETVPERWLEKDLGGLYFSALDVGLTRRDVLRFLRAYYNLPLRDVIARHGPFLQACSRRANTLYMKAMTRRQLPRQVAGLPHPVDSLAETNQRGAE